MSGQPLWDFLIGGSHSSLWLSLAMQRTAKALSDTVGQSFHHDALQVGTMPVAGIAKRIGDPGAKIVGIQLEIKGDARGRALLLIPWESALKLVDLLIEEPSGTTTDLRFEERATLAEVGNLVLAHFLNAVVAFYPEPRHLQPSPGSVMVDKLESVLRLALMPSVVRGADPLTIQVLLLDAGKTVQISLLILPDHVVAPQGTDRS